MRRVLAACVCVAALSVPGWADSGQTQRFATAVTEADRARTAGQWSEAVTLYRKALHLEPGHAQTRFHLASALRETGRYYEARKNFRLALQARAADRAWVSQCRLQMAACWEATGDYREAAVEYRLALKADAACDVARQGERRALAQSESK